MKRWKFSMIELMAGATLKPDNSVVERWPQRLKLKYDEAGAREAFDVAMTSDVEGTNCFLEWQRSDATLVELLEGVALAAEQEPQTD
jgi:hypothetical protein